MRPPVWLVAIVAIVLAAAALRVLGDTPPTTVDGLKVMTVSEVLAERTSGGLRNQPVALGGFWTNATFAHMCTAPLSTPGELEMRCCDDESGITERNEPIVLVGRFFEFAYVAQGPKLTPFFDHGDPGGHTFWQPDGTWGSPPIPIVVVGHFDDPRADLCQISARQVCRDRLVVDRIAYFRETTARWPVGLPVPEPTDPPAPPV